MQAIVESDAVRAEQTRYAVPGWGEGALWTAGGVVLAHDFTFSSAAATGAAPHEGGVAPPSGTVAAVPARMGHGSVSNPRQTLGLRQGGASRRVDPGELVARFAAFFRGEPVVFDDVPLDLTWCTPFQHAVATALRRVPRGEVVSYGELAALAGYPGAQRAAGSFCARNRFLFLLPCHRVVAADGIGAYGSAGISVKRRLLALEGLTR